MNAYEKLYTNLKDRFTVVDGGSEYSFGEFMLKGKSTSASASACTSLTANASTSLISQSPVAAFLGYVSDKLAVKKLPVRDKTIRRFPLRTSLASFFCALIACTLIFSYGSALNNGTARGGYTAGGVEESVEEQTSNAASTLGYTVSESGE